MNVLKIKQQILKEDAKYWDRVMKRMESIVDEHLEKVINLEAQAADGILTADDVEMFKDQERERLAQNPDEAMLFMEQAILDMPRGFRPVLNPNTKYRTFKSKWTEGLKDSDGNPITDKNSNPIRVTKNDTLIDDIKNHEKMKKWDRRNKSRSHSRDRRPPANFTPPPIPASALKRIRRVRAKQAEVMEKING